MAAADAAAAALAREPYDEAALRAQLRAYTLGGQVAAALAAYASTRERLAEELGTDPSPETRRCTPRSCAASWPAPPPRARLPAGAGLVGRDDELAYLDAVAERARDGAAEVIVVDGEAGIGKTTLLRAWAARRAAAGDTVLLAPCGPLDRAMPLDALLTALAGAAAPARARHATCWVRRVLARCSRRCSARCSAPPARRRRPLPVLGRQHARPRGAVRRPGPGAGPAGRTRPAGPVVMTTRIWRPGAGRLAPVRPAGGPAGRAGRGRPAGRR